MRKILTLLAALVTTATHFSCNEADLSDCPPKSGRTSLYYSALIPLTETMGICLYNHTDYTMDKGEPGLTIHYDDRMTANDWQNSGDLEILITFYPNTSGSANDVAVSMTIPSRSDYKVTPEYR